MKHAVRNAVMATAVAAALGIVAGATSAADRKSTAVSAHDHGRYLVTIGGCNDCHTPGYAMSGGKVDEKQWLTGDSLGWRGPWGTTYPINLRLYMQAISEKAWVDKARPLTARPPLCARSTATSAGSAPPVTRRPTMSPRRRSRSRRT